MPRSFGCGRRLQARKHHQSRAVKTANLPPNRTMRSRVMRLVYLVALASAMAGWSWLLLMGMGWAFDL
jgi:hypothetical protein